MAQLLWANLINMYQPPNIDRSELEKIVNRSYLPVLRIFEQNPKITFTLNLPGSTIDLLIKTGFGQVIKKLAVLAERGQIDFTMTPTYQPIIPLYAEEDIDRQIEAHNKINKRYFGIYYKPKGLYSPHLAYSLKAGKVSARFSLKWIAVDERVALLKSYTSLVMDKGAGGIILMPVCRDITWSMNGSFRGKKFPRSASELIQSIIGYANNGNKYLITASDVLNFGHTHSGRHGLLRALYRDGKIRPVSISSLRQFVKRKEFARPMDGSMETFNSGGKRKRPFLSWENDKNPIQQSLWKIYKMAATEIKNAGAKGDPQYIRAREMMDMASGAVNLTQTSCRPWWDSKYVLKTADDLAIAVFVILSSTPKMKDAVIALRQKIYDQVEQFEKSGEMKRQQQTYLKSNQIQFDRFYKK